MPIFVKDSKSNFKTMNDVSIFLIQKDSVTKKGFKKNVKIDESRVEKNYPKVRIFVKLLYL